jgi:enamine deaminase RidA (YjgF/YER057c/UK114 family)
VKRREVTVRTLPLVPVVLSVCLSGVLFAAVQIPEYTAAQLQDKAFLQAQIETFTQLREELAAKSQSATDLVKMTIDKDLKKVDLLLEALDYVQANGYDPKDLKLAQMEYFRGALKPTETGFHHEMTAAGPPGGRVSFMDGKPAGREEAARRGRKPAKAAGYDEAQATENLRRLRGVVSP